MLAVMALIGFASSCSDPKPGISRAAHDGDVEKVKALLQSDPNLVFDRDNYDTTPLHWAAGQGHKDVVELLLANRAAVNAKNKYGDTPLHFAATGGYQDIAELLLDKGAEVNPKNRPIGVGASGETPLRCAEEAGKKDVVEFLRRHGGLE
jgi:ankyrin repeat protein